MSRPAGTDQRRLDPRVGRTRQVTLTAALVLLLEEGWDALTHARLAMASGVSRMTLYRHWPTRVGLLHDTLQEAARVRHAPVSGDLREDLRNELQMVRKELLSPPSGKLKLLATVIERAQTDPEFARLRDESVGEACSGVARILEAGVATGALPKNIDIEAAVTWLVGPLVYRLLVLGKRLTAPFVDEVAESFLVRFEQPISRV